MIPSGVAVESDALLLTAEGPADALHRAWKTAQTLMEWASGIASGAAALVRAAAPVPVACTRQHAPGPKALSITSIPDGGAIIPGPYPHLNPPHARPGTSRPWEGRGRARGGGGRAPQLPRAGTGQTGRPDGCQS